MEYLNKNKVILGLSGGVDSTAAALLLKEKGYEVIGFFFDVSGHNEEGAEEARKAAQQLGIEFIYKDVSDEFEKKVIGNFCLEYIKGRTPNPCVVCNPEIKFKKLLETANETGAYYIATGHYSRIYQDDEKYYYVRRGVNEKKDQSYMLYRLGQDVLSRVIFPLGDFRTKEQVREIAGNSGFFNAQKKDSQEICFISDNEDYGQYILSRGYESSNGNFIDKQNNILGQHRGIIHYTIGQRKGLGISFGKRVFVTDIKTESNSVVLGDETDLFTDNVKTEDFFFTAKPPEFYQDKILLGKTRYSSKKEDLILKIYDKKIIATFLKPQRAVTPGQSIVFYDGDIVIGGGYISG